MKRLDEIAAALGTDRTRDELIPFVNESVDDEDEVLLVLAEKLGKFVALIGGANHAHHLLVPLEALCTVEEITVRDRALTAESVSMHFRVSPENQRAMIDIYTKLSKDDTPMVRRSAATHMGKFCQQMTLEEVTTSIIPLFSKLSKDDQDSVRLLAVDNCILLASILPENVFLTEVLPMAIALARDPSWRVRWSVANQFVELCTPLGHIFQSLLQDDEAEVRTAAASKVSAIAKLISVQSALEKILPQVRCLATDASEHVRSALAGDVMAMAPVLGKENTISHLLPMFLLLLKDSNPDVRLNIISKLSDVNKVIGIGLLSQSLFPAIVDLAEDQQWRV
eukprot:GSMAST32.ASY1.ANO1.276.1 assembled CDS